MSWWMSCSWVFWLFYQVLHSTLFVNADTCGKDMVFKVTLEGKTLTNHVFKTVRATNDAHCQSKCFLEDRCISYSFGTSVSGEKYMCELSDSDHFMHPEDLVDRPGVVYRSAQNTCNCSKNSTCRYNFVDNTHRCECKPGFTGDLCQMSWLKVGSAVCIGSINDQFGKFTIPVACNVLNFKLVYVSGSGIDMGGQNIHKAYWGTPHRSNKELDLHITDTNDNRISPPPDFPLIYTRYGYLTYELPGVTNMDPELTLPELSPPLAVTAGKKFRIWFDQDLNNDNEYDNSGQTCADVWIKKENV